MGWFFPAGYYMAAGGWGGSPLPQGLLCDLWPSLTTPLPAGRQQEAPEVWEAQTSQKGPSMPPPPRPQHALSPSKPWVWIIHFVDFSRPLLHPSEYFFLPGVPWPIGAATSLSNQGHGPGACQLLSWLRQEAKENFQRKWKPAGAGKTVSLGRCCSSRWSHGLAGLTWPTVLGSLLSLVRAGCLGILPAGAVGLGKKKRSKQA